MKKIMLILMMVLVSQASFSSTSNLRIYKPIAVAVMEITEIQGNINPIPSFARRAVLIKTMDVVTYGPSPRYGFILRSRLVQGNPNFDVFRISVDGCGSTHFEAVTRGFTTPRPGIFHSIHLVDHSTRICQDVRPYEWEATVTKTEQIGYDGPAILLGQFTMVGNPRAVQGR